MTDARSDEQIPRAETVFREEIDFSVFEKMSRDEGRKFFEKLQAHQNELKRQNQELRRIQMELSRARDRYASLFENAPTGYLRVDSGGLILQSNRAFAKMVGEAQGKLSGRPLADLIYGPERDQFLAQFPEFFQQPLGKVMNLRMIGGEKGLFHGCLLGNQEVIDAFAEEDRAVQEELLLIVADVSPEVDQTEEKAGANETHKKRKNEVTALLDASRAILEHTDFRTAAKRIFKLCKDITGATAGYVALLNDNGDENEVLFLDAGGLPCTVDPDLPMPIRGLREVAYRKREAVYDNGFDSSDWVRFLPHGHVSLRNVMFAPLTHRGKAMGLIGLANKAGDFTDEDAAFAQAFGDIASIGLINSVNLDRLQDREQQLARNLARTESILESISDAFFSLDENWQVTYFNAAAEKQLDRRASDVLGKKLFDAFPEAKGSIFEERYARVFQTKKPDSFEVYFEVPPYENWYEVRVYPQERGISVYFQVITARKLAEREKERLEEQLRHAQKMEAVGQLAAGVAHDFNNMLSPILGYSEIILADMDAHSPNARKVQTIIKAATRSRDLVQQLLAFGRKQMLNMETFDLARAVFDSVKLVRRTIRETIKVDLELGADTPSIRGDVTQIGQIVMNLAINAQDAMPVGGVLKVRTGAAVLDEAFVKECPELLPGFYAKLEVRDNGSGINKNVLPFVFEPFFTTKNKAEGTGLGLASVYGIAKQHGGHVTVESEVGQGTCFTVYIPGVNGDTHRTISADVVAPAKKGVRGTVLVVEDNALVRELAEEILKRYRYGVLSAASPTEALELATTHTEELDILLTDVVMPDMTGRELYHKLREQRPELGIVYMSGYTENVIARHGVIDEGVRLITKPFTVSQLVDAISTALERNK